MKEAEEKAQLEKEHIAKQQAKQEQHNNEQSGRSPSPKIEEEEKIMQGGGGDEGQSISFQVKRQREQQKEGPWKKSKVNKPPLDPIMLMEGDLDEIGDRVLDTITHLLQQFEQQHLQSLGYTIQKDALELQIQTNRIQVGISQVGAAQISLAAGISQNVELIMTVDLRTTLLPERSLSVELANDKVIVSTLKNIDLKIVALPNEYLHALQTSVKTKLRAWEQNDLSLINEYRVNNEQMFTKKTEALKERYKIKEQNA